MLKVQSYITSTFAFFFDVCGLALENANVKCEYNHLLHVTWEQGFSVICQPTSVDLIFALKVTHLVRLHYFRVPRLWKPFLQKRVFYSEILDKYLGIQVTLRTLDLIDEAYGFDNYVLKVFLFI